MALLAFLHNFLFGNKTTRHLNHPILSSSILSPLWHLLPLRPLSLTHIDTKQSSIPTSITLTQLKEIKSDSTTSSKCSIQFLLVRLPYQVCCLCKVAHKRKNGSRNLYPLQRRTLLHQSYICKLRDENILQALYLICVCSKN